MRELWLSLGDGHHQAALVFVVPVTSTPSLNLIPSMTGFPAATLIVIGGAILGQSSGGIVLSRAA